MAEEQNSRVRLTRRGQVALLELTAPETLNALVPALVTELAAHINTLATSAAELPVAVITGTGRAFCAGGDVKGMDRGEVGPAYLDEINRFVLQMTRMDTVVLAAVNGLAYGGGFSLALACDGVFAAEEAVFCMAHTQVGLVPDMGAHYFLPRAVGLMRAREILMSGRRVTSAEGLQLGFVNRMVSGAELLPQTLEYAQKLAAGPTTALRLIKRTLANTYESSLADILAAEAAAQQTCFATQDHREAVRALLERRPPLFTGK